MARVRLRLFAAARDAAGRGEDVFEAATVADVLDQAVDRYGPPFRAVLGSARVWVDGDEPSDGLRTLLGDGAEVAVLPPVSGG